LKGAPRMNERYNLPCNIAQTLNLIGDRWTLLILHEIFAGSHSFNQIKRNLQGLSSRLLSERLRCLEEAGLLAAELYSAHPPRYHYTLTESGKALEPVFNALILWGRHHLKRCYKKLVHAECGHEVQIAYYCEHCGTNVGDVAAVPIEEADLAEASEA
jgi:Predicted transcriptional regulators